MRHAMTWVVAGTLCALMLVGCAESASSNGASAVETIGLKVVETATGGLEIDDSYHDTAVVFRGDRVEWKCDCPEGTEFTVDRLHLLKDLEHEQGPDEGEAAAPPGPCDTAAERSAAVAHPLFGEWTPPGRDDRWVAGDGSFRSAPVARGAVDHGVWKFRWKVRRAGEPDSAVCWDPHIFGHTDRARF